MRILVTTPYFYPEGGGLEKYAYNILSGLSNEGFEIKVFCSTKGEEKRDFINGIEIVRLRADRIISNTPIRLDLLYILLKELKKERYILINSHTPVPYFAEMGAIASYLSSIPYVLTYHAGSLLGSTRQLEFIAKIMRYTTEKIIFNRACKIITVSELVKNNYLSRYYYKVDVIPPGVDTKKYIPNPDGYDYDGKRLLFIGSLTPSYEWKGLRVLLKSMPLIISKHKDVHLTVIGEGSLKEDFERMCKDFASNVTFMGRVCEDDLIKAYQSSTLLILPSTTDAEALSLVALEANSCGIPVVASRVGGIPYYIKNGINGYLIEPRDYKILADKVIELLDDSKLLKELSIKSRMYAENFDWKYSILRTRVIFEKCYS